MKISIFGLGYVGAVSAGCLAQDGHDVIGVDPYIPKVNLINEGKTPVIEKDIGDIIAAAVKDKRLRATTDFREAIDRSQLSLICVGTPSQLNGSLDLKYIRNVCEQIGEVLKSKSDFHVVVVRSTMLPGNMMSTVIPILEEKSDKKAGVEFGICNNPEFLREGSAVYDYYNPPKTVIGELEARGGEALAGIYEKLCAPLIRTDIETSEMVKYVDNVWHALKVGFANEIGNVCKQLGLDSHKVMDIFCEDTKLNLSPYYLKPGFAFGGACLPKDLRALTYKARSVDLELPILNAILPSNEHQIERGIQMVRDKKNNKVGVLGMSFKTGTDDLRESPIVELIERLLGKGYDIRIYDRNVQLAALKGANKDFILNRIPHISKLLVDSIDAILEHAETIVIGNGDREYEDMCSRISTKHVIVDLVRIGSTYPEGSQYDGICW
jgi:GDP-mannose 6-dehydrogenase